MIGGKKLYRMLCEDISVLSVKIGRDAFFDILRKHGLLIKRRRKYISTTNSHHHFRKYKNLIKEIKISYANQVFVSDITYIRLAKGFCYLFLLTDVYSRKIVGYHLSHSLGIEGALKALQMSMKQVNKPSMLIHHSDRGIQYCSNNYTSFLIKRRAKISMGEVGNPYENAIAERVNGILKNEFMLDQTFKSFQQARKTTLQAIEIYNNMRPHLSLNYMTPEKKYAA